jgi:transcriptional regulator with GAF, ATPase, and Fis domain
MRAVLREVRRYGKTRLPALVLGDTGTGKELIARALHRSSPRADRPFVAVSCPNLPGQLVESELFGHSQGAFTGAVRLRTGAFEEANGGTLFLDEIGDMAVDVQAKILRVLQEGVIRRLGDNREIRVDVRVVAATWRDLREMVSEGKFREDLYNRLAYCVVRIPSLHERGHDVVRIARALLVKAREKHGLPRRSLSREAEDVLLAERWPGNVRELERVLFRAVATGAGRSLTAADLHRVLERPGSDEAPAERPTRSVEEVLGERGEIGAGDLRAALGVSKTQLARVLAPLVEQQVVVRHGRGAATRYRLAERGPVAAIDDPRWALALAIARREGRVTRTALAEATVVSERTATRVLGAMVEAGLLVEDGGRGRSAGYLRTEPAM